MLLKLIIPIICLLSIGCKAQTCRTNEIYRTCGTACEPSCDKPYPGVCTMQCKTGCQCRSGYFRNKATNTCVLLSQCPATTTRRPTTTTRRGGTTTKKPVLTACYNVNCAANRTTCAMVQSIACAQQYYPPPPRYPTDYPSYPSWPNWPQPTPPIYPPYRQPQPNCPLKAMCIRNNGCRNMRCPRGSKCVLQEVYCFAPPCDPLPMCVPDSTNNGNQCGLNEVYSYCSLPSYCERKCDNLNTLIACPAICGPPACQCASGYYRNRSGRCVPQLVCYLQALIDAIMGNQTQRRLAMSYLQDGNLPAEMKNWLEGNWDLTQNRPSTEPWPMRRRGRQADTDATNSESVSVESPESNESICPEGEQCIAVEPTPEQCRQNNCRSQAKCVGAQRDDPVPSSSVASCATVRCASGTQCTETSTGPICQAQPSYTATNSGCAAVMCASGYKCVDNENGVSCQPYADSGSAAGPRIVQPVESTDAPDLSCSMSCPPGEGCLMMMNACISYPCYPTPTCVELATTSASEPQATDCASITCPSDSTCVMTQPSCTGAAPCFAQPQCVPVDATPSEDHATDDCQTMECASGYVCVTQNIQCFAPPCNPISECVPMAPTTVTATPTPSTTTSKTLTCATVKCRGDSYCIENNGHPMCINKYLSCPNTTCTYEEVCRVIPANCEQDNCQPTTICQASSNTSCGQNEIYRECARDCEANCENLTPACSRFCRSPSCQCADGFVRDINGNCVEQSQCPQIATNTADEEVFQGVALGQEIPIGQCQENEQMADCAGSVNCQLHCTAKKMICNMMCIAGCVCIPGYVRDDATELCIPQSSCPEAETSTSCSLNETFSTCSTNKDCQPACVPTDMMCPAICVEGCECLPNYVRNETGYCILQGDCPPLGTAQEAGGIAIDENESSTQKNITCGNNEQYMTCKSCDGSCHDPNAQNCVTTEMCTPGCNCLTGYVRIGSKCQPLNRCPNYATYTASNGTEVYCPPSEVYSECMSSCEQHCRGDMVCAEVSVDVCVAGCECAVNYKRNKNGDCVHNRECYKSAGCTETETWSHCLSCESKCGQPSDPACNTTCYSGCGCSSGFSRSSTGECVPSESC